MAGSVHFIPIDGARHTLLRVVLKYFPWGGELGVRWFFFSKATSEPWHVRPYASISGGATWVDGSGGFAASSRR